jgi:hypothetical protein
MPNKRIPIRLLCAFAVATSLIQACEDEDNENDDAQDLDDNKPKLKGGPYAMLSFVENSFFLDVMDSLNIGTYSLKNSHEVWGHNVFCYDGKVFITTDPSSGNADDMEVFTVGDDNSLTHTDTMVVDEDSGLSDLLYLNENEAYISLHLSGKVLKINPTTFETLAEIDLTHLAIGEDGVDMSDDNSPEPANLTIRDDKLYVVLSQSYMDVWMGRPGMHVAVIDMETNTLETTISDEERGYAYAGHPGGTGSSSFLDENGDLYISAVASWGYDPEQKGGMLRIKAGEEVFDPDWEFDLTEKPVMFEGQEVEVVYFSAMAYAGDGIAYAKGNMPAFFSDPPDWTDRVDGVFKIDLINNTLEALPLPRTTEYSPDLILDGDLLVMPMQAESGNGVYIYDTVTGDYSAEAEVVLPSPVMSICAIE